MSVSPNVELTVLWTFKFWWTRHHGRFTKRRLRWIFQMCVVWLLWRMLASVSAESCTIGWGGVMMLRHIWGFVQVTILISNMEKILWQAAHLPISTRNILQSQCWSAMFTWNVLWYSRTSDTAVLVTSETAVLVTSDTMRYHGMDAMDGHCRFVIKRLYALISHSARF